MSQETLGLFDPALYQNVRLPRERARTLPVHCYLDQEWFDREMATLFRPAWHFVGLAGTLTGPGDYFTTTLFGESLIVLRDDENQVRALRNTCRHRGSLILEKDRGTCRGLRCPYHSWTYGLDGTLLRAPGLEGEQPRAALGGLGLDLIPLACGVRDGLIFVNLSPEDSRAPLDTYLGDFTDQVTAPHCVDRMAPVHEREYVLESNWKLYVEVDMETLHTKHIHRSSIGEQPVTSPQTTGEWISVFNRSAHTPALKPDERHLGFPHIKELEGEAAAGTHFSIVLPGFFLVTAPDCMWWIHKIPEGPERTRVRVGYCFPRSTIERPDFDARAERYIERWDQVIREDDWITEYQHRGLRGSIPGPYTREEAVVHRLDNWILDRVLAG